MKSFDIKKLYTALGLNKTDFASKLGVSHVAITNIENRKKISKHMITTICAVFPQVNKAYLETMHGEVFVHRSQANFGDLPAHETAQHYTPYPDDPPDLPELIEKFLDVMRSNDDITREALKQNVIAFHLSIQRAEGKPPQPGSNDFKSKKKRAV